MIKNIKNLKMQQSAADGGVDDTFFLVAWSEFH